MFSQKIILRLNIRDMNDILIKEFPVYHDFEHNEIRIHPVATRMLSKRFTLYIFHSDR